MSSRNQSRESSRNRGERESSRNRGERESSRGRGDREPSHDRKMGPPASTELSRETVEKKGRAILEEYLSIKDH
jgi:hypothetical protein